MRLELDNDQFMIGSFIFQFHKGAIRTDVSSNKQYNDIYFNSIKVRLERRQQEASAGSYDISIP